jgi:hypothetical protein
MRLLVESLQSCIAEAVAGDRDYTETFAVIGKPELWFQLSWDYFNLAMPYESIPEVGELPDGVGIDAFEPRAFLTLSHSAENVEQLCAFFIRVVEVCWQIPVGSETIARV